MDFILDDQQSVLRDLAAQILGDRFTNETHRELEAGGTWFDTVSWKAFADAGLLGVAVPVEYGGLGLGFMEVALIAAEVGRTTAKIPFTSTAIGGLALAEFADAAVAAHWLPRVAAGDAVIALGIADRGNTVSAAEASGGLVLNGHVSFVPSGANAQLLVVPVSSVADVKLVVIDLSSAGIVVVPQPTMVGAPETRFVFTNASVVCELAGTLASPDPVEWLRQRAVSALCSTASGVVEEALRLTAEYVRVREQFNKLLATFQAVSQRTGDAYINVRAIRLTALQAAWRLSVGLPAAAEVAVAKYWASAGGQEVLSAATHLHGGIGVDRDYPLHRYFLTARSIDLTLGGATEHLRRIGKIIASD